MLSSDPNVNTDDDSRSDDDDDSESDDSPLPPSDPMPLPEELLKLLWLQPTQEQCLASAHVNRVARPDADYMRLFQPDISGKMRTILVNWLMEVAFKFRLHEDTIHMACWVLDRFLCVRQVGRDKLQLVGCASLLIACKTEEMYGLSLDRLVRVSDKAFTRSHLKAAESAILNALGFNLGHHTLHPFNWHQFLQYCPCPLRASLTAYLWDSSLLQYPLVHCNKMTILVACVLVAKLMVRRGRRPSPPTGNHMGNWKKHGIESVFNKQHVRVDVPDFTHVKGARKCHALIKYGLVIPGQTRCCPCCHHAADLIVPAVTAVNKQLTEEEKLKIG